MTMPLVGLPVEAPDMTGFDLSVMSRELLPWRLKSSKFSKLDADGIAITILLFGE